MQKEKEDKRGKVNLWQERLRKNEAAMAADYASMEKFMELYDGTRKIDKVAGASKDKPAADATMVRNVVAELMEAQVDASFPMPKVTARKEEHEALARNAEDYLRNETDRMPFERLNDMDERISPVIGGSMVLVEWDSDRHTHETRGELCVTLLHPRQVVFQEGVNEIEDMDFIIVNTSMTKAHVKEKYGLSVESEKESDPASRGGKGNADDVVTVHIGYFRNKEGGIGRFTWVNDTMLEDLEDYQARRGKKCAHCGMDMTGMEKCQYCGSTKAEDTDSDTFQLYEDVQLSDGRTISRFETVLEYPEGVDEMMVDDLGNPYEAIPQEVQRAREIPYYKPDVYPIVLRRNVSAWGKVLGDSDVAKIADLQNAIKKCDTRIMEKLDKGGSVLTKHRDSVFDKTDEELKIMEVENPAELSCFTVQSLQVNPALDQNISEAYYVQMKNILGITDSFLGRTDRTATSGVAKQLAISQSAGRLESKKIMKNAMYADLYEVMFKFLLAYSDEPRPVRHKNADGRTEYGEFNKFDYLAQDAAGEWYWIDDFLFSVDNSGALAGNREAMWQEIRMNLQTGAFGNPQEIDTLILFWGLMAGQHYPGAAEIKDMLERKNEMQQQAQQPMPQQPQGMNAPAEQGAAQSADFAKQNADMPEGVGDMAVEDGSGSTMNMMGGLANAMQ